MTLVSVKCQVQGIMHCQRGAECGRGRGQVEHPSDTLPRGQPPRLEKVNRTYGVVGGGNFR